MNLWQIPLTLSFLFFFTACSKIATEPKADVVYRGGKIYTVNQDQPWAQAIGVTGDRISFVGSDEHVESHIGSNTRVIELNGAMVMPGIHDAHSHMIWGSADALFACKLGFQADPTSIIKTLKECEKNIPDSAWLSAVSAWSEQFPGKRFHRSILDDAFPNRPVLIIEGSHHHVFVNSKALELAGITDETPDPFGGRIIRDEDGVATGELAENASVLAKKFLAPLTQEQLEQAVVEGTKLFSRQGITSTQEASATNNALLALKAVDGRGELRQRFATHIIWGSEAFSGSTNDILMQTIQNREKYKSQHIYPDFAKVWIDGTPTPPYFTQGKINPKTLEVDLKDILVPPDEFNDFMIEMDKAGVKTKIHVAGPGGAHVALDGIQAAREANPNSYLKHELAHTNIILPSDMDRMAELDIVGEMSPTIWHLYPPVLGFPPMPAWPFDSLNQRGILMSIGTDWPVTNEPNVFPALQGLVERKSEGLDLKTGIEMLTINGAKAVGWEKELGSIEPGKIANFIVLSQNLFEIPSSEIAHTKVLKTVFEGELVHNISISIGAN